MRKAMDRQQRLDCQPIVKVTLNRDCRDEIIPILMALQHLYAQPKLCDEILRALLAADNLLAPASESLARVMKAEDGTIGRANGWVLSLRPAKTP